MVSPTPEELDELLLKTSSRDRMRLRSMILDNADHFDQTNSKASTAARERAAHARNSRIAKAAPESANTPSRTTRSQAAAAPADPSPAKRGRGRPKKNTEEDAERNASPAVKIPAKRSAAKTAGNPDVPATPSKRSKNTPVESPVDPNTPKPKGKEKKVFPGDKRDDPCLRCIHAFCVSNGPANGLCYNIADSGSNRCFRCHTHVCPQA